MPKPAADGIDRKIGQNLMLYRKRRRLSRGALGSIMKTPISAQALIGYEEGTTRIPAAALVELAWLLNAKVSDLLVGVSELLPKTRPEFNNPAIANITKAITIELSERAKL